MTTLERCPHPHAWPAVDCGMCDCLHYETARRRHGARVVSDATAAGIALFVAAFWGAVGAGIVRPLIRAIGGR